MVTIDTEQMADFFTKYHIRGLAFDAVIHKFSKPDEGYPHSHPFSFRSFVLKGSYIERRYIIDEEAGSWTFTDIVRNAGDSFIVFASTIHQIIELPEGECWTIILPKHKVIEPGFYRFEQNAIHYRQWNKEWKQIY